MFTTGSSALNYEPRRQMISPSLRITMREGLNYGTTVSPWPLASATDMIREMRMFKDKIFVSSLQMTPEAVPNFVSYDWNNATLYYSDNTNIPYDIFINGNTAVLYYTNNYGNSVLRDIYRMFTSDGITFGGSQGVITGSSYYIFDLVSVGDSQLYAKSGQQVLSISKAGANWGQTILYNRDLDISDAIAPATGESSRKYLLAQRFNNSIDRILLINGNADCGDGLHVIETDGLNVFSDIEVLDMDTRIDRKICFGNFVGVSGVYYLPIMVDDIRNSQTDGLLDYRTEQYGLHLMQSMDFLNWSIPIYVGHSEIIDLYDAVNCGIIAGGSLPYLFSILGKADAVGDTANRLDFFKGSSSLDVSKDIIDYSNQNNERVSLTLGNLK